MIENGILYSVSLYQFSQVFFPFRDLKDDREFWITIVINDVLAHLLAHPNLTKPKDPN